jgi:hypothetical protein
MPHYSEENYLAEESPNVSRKYGAAFYGAVSSSFIKEITAGWQSIPHMVGVFLEESGYGISAGRVMMDIPGGHCLNIPNDPYGRIDPNHIQAIYVLEYNRAFFSEYSLTPGIGQNIAPDLSFDALESGIWKSSEDFLGNMAYGVRHESAHAFDRVLGVLIGMPVSASPDFVDAYFSDLSALGGYEGAFKKGYFYFVRPSENVDVGMAELFADLLVDEMSGDPFVSRVRFDWKKAGAFVADFQKKFTGAYSGEILHPNFKKFLAEMRSPFLSRSLAFSGSTEIASVTGSGPQRGSLGQESPKGAVLRL